MSDSIASRATLIDLSHTITHGLVTYKGLPAPIICDYMSREQSRRLYAPGTEFQIGKIEMVANTGTYLDSPFHRYEDGKDLSQIGLNRLANLPAVKISISCQQAIDESDFRHHGDLAGKAVLVETGWSQHWNSPRYYEGHPFLTKAAARFLVASGVGLVGIDSHNIDDVQDLRRPVHSILLEREIPIVEHMTNLAVLPANSFRFFAVPAKVMASARSRYELSRSFNSPSTNLEMSWRECRLSLWSRRVAVQICPIHIHVGLCHVRTNRVACFGEERGSRRGALN